MSTETIPSETSAPSTTGTAIEAPKETQMAKSVVDKFFNLETPSTEEPKKEAPVVEKKPDPIVEKKSEPVQQTRVTEKPKSKTAQEFDNQRTELEGKVKEAQAQRDEVKAQIVDMQNELSELRTKATSWADYEEIKQKKAELDKTITLINVERHPDFIKKYTIQEEDIYKNVSDVLEGVENKDKIISALKMPPSEDRDAKLDELKQDLGITKISKIAAYEARLDEINKNRKLEIENSHIAKRLYDEEDKNKADHETKAREQVFNKYAQYFSENDVTYKKRDGDEAFNQNVETRLNEARRLYFESTPDERAQAMLAAVDRPILLSLIQKLSEELNTATGALNGKLAATPGVGASRKDEPTKPASFVDAIAQAYK